MAYGYIIPQKTAAMDVRTLNRSAIFASADIENGSVLQLLSKTGNVGEDEVWTPTQAATGALTNLWMAYSPEIVLSGLYKGLDPDPRNFINKAGKVMDMFKPQLGDIVLFSADAVGGVIGTGNYMVATNAQYKLQFAAAAVTGLSFHVIATTYVSLATGSIDTQRVVMYQAECVAI